MLQQPPMQYQLAGHAQNFEPSADICANGWSEIAALGRVTGAYEPPHPPMLDIMVFGANINLNSDMNVGDASAAMLGPPGLVTMHLASDMYAGNSDVWQQQRPPLLHENAHAPINGQFLPGAKGTARSMALGASDDTCTNGDTRTVKLHWQGADGIRLQAEVLIMDQIRDSMTSLWPRDLLLEIDVAGVTVEIQTWMHTNKAAVARVKCASEKDNRSFDDLVELLRSHRAYATAGWEARGSYQTRLLLAPLSKDLICASFTVDGMPTPPTSRSREPDCVKSPVAPNSLASQCSGSRPALLPDPMVMSTSPERPHNEAAPDAPTPQQPDAQPQPCTQPQADYVPVEDTMELSQVDSNPFEAITFAPPVPATSQPQPQSAQQTFTQALLQHSVAQPSQQVTTLYILIGSRTDEVNSSDGIGSKWPLKGDSDPWFGIGDADAIEPSADSSLGVGGGGLMDVIETCAIRSPSADSEDM